MGECTGINFVDSTPIRVCQKKRLFNHKVFQGIASRGKYTMGWFYGFKIHIIVNEIGQVVEFQITLGNVDDRKPLESDNVLKKIWGNYMEMKGM